ncbi:KICSTOR complex protein SZT2 [Nymphon striatum]|nr:KICSTOR complex protein SZT2 [Nymphon striatum]
MYNNLLIQPEFRPRTLSGASEKDQNQDNISLSSKMSGSKSISKSAISLNVHGITEPSHEITETLVKVLQKQLDDAVLADMCNLLDRSPQCKLSPADVQFIQKSNEPPTMVLQYTLPSHALPYLQAFKFYLRQNLKLFLTNQKYTNSQPETHFQGFVNGATDYSTLEEDVFLHTRPFHSGSRGIACLVLSIIDNQGQKMHINESVKPTSAQFKPNDLQSKFDLITATSLYDSCQIEIKLPGPMALIQFQVWEKGFAEIENLKIKLCTAIQHSLWDLYMEYRMIIAPLCASTQEDEIPPSYCSSEPSTPLKKGRSGSSTSCKDLDGSNASPFSLNIQLKEHSHSIPDVTTGKIKSSTKVFKASPSNFSASKTVAVDFESGTSKFKEESEKQKYEMGDTGHLLPIFYTNLVNFIEYACKSKVPSAETMSCKIKSEHSVTLFLHEVQCFLHCSHHFHDLRIFKNHRKISNILNYNVKDFVYEPVTDVWTPTLKDDEDQITLEPGETMDYILVARNFQQWYDSQGRLYFPKADMKEIQCYLHLKNESNPNESTQKLFHNSSKKYVRILPKFLPMTDCVELPSEDGTHRFSLKDSQTVCSNASSPSPSGDILTNTNNVSVIIPRQQIMILLLKNKKINVLLYNWQNDVASELFRHVEKLTEWHSSRAKVLNNIILQKMGLFHRELQSLNNYPSQYLETKASGDFSKPFSSPQVPSTSHVGRNLQSSKSHAHYQQSQQSIPHFREIFRNAKPSQPLHRTSAHIIRDPIHQYRKQIVQIRDSDRKEIDKKLCSIWHNRGSAYDIPITNDMLKVFKQKSRMFHYCMSPFLFLPSWKLQCGIARDHSVPTIPKAPSRKRNESGISIKSNKKTKVDPKPQNDVQESPRERKESGSEEEWHVALCSSLLHEYAQYLQTLGGYILVKTRPPSPRKQVKIVSSDKDESPSTSGSSTKLVFPKFYLVKSVLGGLIGIEIGYTKPFFMCRLYGLNCILLQSRGCNLLNSQVYAYRITKCTEKQYILTKLSFTKMTLFFLDECDKIKVLMHLHSFTFDFHLFTIYSYISGRQLLFRQGYHLISFLDDFSKYYQKSPMFARNRLHADSLIIPNTSCFADDLFEYILKHNSLYKMKVFKMNALHLDCDFPKLYEHALIKLSTHKVCYKDSNDIEQSEEFDLALIVCHDSEVNYSNNYQLALKFFIILTSRKGLYPKLSLEEDSGTFQIVHSCNRRKSIITQPSTETINEVPSISQDSPFNDEPFESNSDDVFKSDNMSGISRRIRSPGSMCKEAVNYLGYFSCEETLMYDILQDQAKIAQVTLKQMVEQAMVDCRRDMLWDRLLVGVGKHEDGKKKRDDSKESLHLSLNFNDFKELLDLVHTKPLDSIDYQLTPFFNMHLSWYQGLVKVLLTKYSETCRVYTSNDGSLQHVAILDPNYLEIFILMSINQKTNKTFQGLFHLTGKELSQDRSANAQAIATQSLIEGFIGACCFHLWCKLL